jgi:hypothetical protein
MPKRLLIAVIIFIACLTITANDGAYLSSGSVIYPVIETKISLEREILSFTCSDKISGVNIYFEFLNPEKTERKILMGFQAPYPVGDIPYPIRSNTQISNFKILINGQLIPYKIKSSKCEDCELTDTSEVVINQNTTGIYVYLFEGTFKPGINVINHSYDFPASSNVLFNENYNYVLKTGSKWAGGLIKDFTLQIDMGTNSYFFVKDIFTGQSDWKIIGTGKVTDKYFSEYNYSGRMIRVSSGKLEINAGNFKPLENIHFGIFGKNSYFSYVLDRQIIPRKITNAMVSLTTDFRYKPETYSNEELKILRNAVFAQHGFAFKSKELQNFFNQFDWYMPDPNLTEDKIILTESEKNFISEIIEKEKQNP